MPNNYPTEHEMLLQKGFIWLGKCHCEGILRHDYSGLEKIVYIYPTNNAFRIKGAARSKPIKELYEFIENL